MSCRVNCFPEPGCLGFIHARFGFFFDAGCPSPEIVELQPLLSGNEHDSIVAIGAADLGCFFVSVTAQLIQQAGDRGPEYIAERAAEIADEMLFERRERCAERRSAPVDWVGPA